ncbi:xylulokinase [Candidatus Aerophobetes bacterium]|nr:xylulokinase [Candidatus Aerophobetes bacterium]
MKELILAHDIGTTGNKATLYDPEGELLASSFSPYPTYYPEVNWAEQNPEDWWIAVCSSTVELLKRAKISSDKIACISFSGQMMGCLPVDKKGIPLRRAIIWADQRGENQARIFRDKIEEKEVYRITGHRISSTYSACKIMWVRENEPDVFKNTFKILHAKDYIIFKLTGKMLTDYSDASGMNLFDLKRKTWSEAILKATKIPQEILPEPHSSLEIAGELTLRSAKEMKLLPGIPVVIGGGDGPCASVGAGVVDEGDCYNYLGSSSWIAITSREPVYDTNMRTFTFHHVAPDKFMPAGTMQTAGGSYQWLKENICKLETKIAKEVDIDPYKILDLKVNSSSPGSNNLLFLPYLMGERSPHWNPKARGAFIGLTITHKREDIIRSVLEGVAFNLKIILDILKKQIPLGHEMRVIGGLARSLTFCQILSDVYNKRISRPHLVEEATSLGAAITGGVAVGVFKDLGVAKKLVKLKVTNEPRPECREKYDSLYRVFKKAYSALSPIYEELADIR